LALDRFFAVIAALAAFAGGRCAHAGAAVVEAVERLSELYWELRTRTVNLSARLARLEGGGDREASVAAPGCALPAGTAAFVPLSSVKRCRPRVTMANEYDVVGIGAGTGGYGGRHPRRAARSKGRRSSRSRRRSAAPASLGMHSDEALLEHAHATQIVQHAKDWASTTVRARDASTWARADA